MLQISASEGWLLNIQQTPVGEEEGKLHGNSAWRQRERGGAPGVPLIITQTRKMPQLKTCTLG